MPFPSDVKSAEPSGNQNTKSSERRETVYTFWMQLFSSAADKFVSN